MPHKQPTTSRLEAFSDGVIAVIITIMVLELKVPPENGLAGLHKLAPILGIYLLSFAFTGIYWINHQHLLERIKTADRATMYANLIFLFFLSLLPFSTSYVLEKELDSFAVACYAVSMVATGFAFLLLRLAIHRHLNQTQELEREDRSARNKHLVSLLLYACSIPLAFYHPVFALALIAVVTLVWILPDLAVPKQPESY
jgi:uncharacterized membrane protein